MSQVETVLSDLKVLKVDLNAAVNRLWTLRMALSQAQRDGHAEDDFLPRRLKALYLREEAIFETSLQSVNKLLADQLDNPLFLLNSAQDLKSWLGIRKTLRYIRNSFSNDYPVANTLVRLNKALQGS